MTGLICGILLQHQTTSTHSPKPLKTKKYFEVDAMCVLILYPSISIWVNIFFIMVVAILPTCPNECYVLLSVDICSNVWTMNNCSNMTSSKF